MNAGDVVGEGNAHYNISNASKASGGMKGAIEHMQQAHACYARCFGAEHSEAVDAQGAGAGRAARGALQRMASRSSHAVEADHPHTIAAQHEFEALQ